MADVRNDRPHAGKRATGQDIREATSGFSPRPVGDLAPGPICGLPAWALAAAIRVGRLAVREVMDAYLDRIEAIDPLVNAIVSLRPRSDLQREADEADAALAAGIRPGPLYGLPFAVKDLASTKGLRTTFGSSIHEKFVPDRDSYFVSRIRDAGALIIGKTNVPEFGLGSHTYNAVFGTTRNAYGTEFTAGGSSGGAAAALALHLLPVADGSDMGGSLRNPAAYNSIYGLRPSQGRVASGPAAESFLSQLGQAGPMGRYVADIGLLLDVQAGHDPRAPLSLGEREDFAGGVAPRVAGARIAWLADLGGHLAMEDGILALCTAALQRLQQAGASVEEHLPAFDFEKLWQAFVTLRQATGGARLKVYYDDPHHRSLLKPEAIYEVEGALGLTALDVYAASQTRTAWYQAVVELFDDFDFLALPTAQVFPFPVEWQWPEQVAGRKMDSYHRWMEVCALATMAGLPAISVPVGFDAQGRSMGMQLIGRPRGDRAVLSLAAGYEELTTHGVP